MCSMPSKWIHCLIQAMNSVICKWHWCVQFSSVVQLCRTLCMQSHGLQHARLPCPSPISRACSNSCPSSWWCHPTTLFSVVPFSSCLQSFPAPESFSNESALCIRWPKYWSFSFSISPSNEYPGLLSFRMDWLDLLAVQGTLKSLLQHHSSKASILRYSAFFNFHIHNDYWKNHSLVQMDLCWQNNVSAF